MPILSVIVPIYNTAKYLKKCVTSIQQQSFTDIEILLIDDGSTDDSAIICKELQANDNRIHYVHQKNAGEIATRSTGVFVAKGEYVAFVDSDDYLDKDYYEKAMNIELKYNADMFDCGFYLNEKIKITPAIEVGLYSTTPQIDYVRQNFLQYHKENKGGIMRSNVTKIFKRKILIDVLERYNRYNKRIDYGADNIISCMYLLCCKSVYISDICGYRYVNHQGSSSHRFHGNYLQTIADYYSILNEEFSKNEDSKYLLSQLESDILKNFIVLAPKFMGFSIDNQIQRYFCPFKNNFSKKIALYGAGSVGIDYYKDMLSVGITPEIWVDKNYEKKNLPFSIVSPNRLNNTEFDFLIIAVLYEFTAKEIKEELIKIGVPSEKILWKNPIEL